MNEAIIDPATEQTAPAAVDGKPEDIITLDLPEADNTVTREVRTYCREIVNPDGTVKEKRMLQVEMVVDQKPLPPLVTLMVPYTPRDFSGRPIGPNQIKPLPIAGATSVMDAFDKWDELVKPFVEALDADVRGALLRRGVGPVNPGAIPPPPARRNKRKY